MKTKITLALVAVIAFAMPADAGAHISLQPDEATAGEFTVLDVRVPNEGSGPATTKVSVRFPPGFFYALYQAVPGWSVKVKTRKPPNSEVREITWTADSNRAGIQAGQLLDFPIGTQLPGEIGDTLTFKAVQTYEDGAVRWVGGPESERPAPRVVITDDGVDRGAAASGTLDADDSDSDGNGLAIAALVVGIVALLLGGGALLLGALLGSGRLGPRAVEPDEGMASPHPPSQLRLEDALEEVDREQDEDDDDQNRDDAHSSPSGRE
ncbi:MAG TPA: YcnI family protein [Solirubrobacterales bacterium]|nr:YcnI family protein [Solirubrobacterales bacterium]